MAPALIQSMKATSVALGSTINKTFVSNATAGNRIFVYVCCSSTTSNAPTGGGITFTALASNVVTTDQPQITVYSGVVVTTASLTITATTAGAHELGFTAEEWSGLSTAAGSGCVDVSATGGVNANSTSNCASGTTVATHASGQLAITFVGDWGNLATWTLSTANGFTKNSAASLDADGNAGIAVANKISSSGVTEGAATWTEGGTSDSDCALVVVIKLGATNTPVTLTAGLSFAGAQTKATSSHRTAALGFTGVTTKATTRSLAAASLGFTGALPRSTGKKLSGVLSFTGSQTKATSHRVTAALLFVGITTRAITRPLAGALSFTGATTKATTRALTGALSFTGSTARNMGKSLAAGLGFSGSQTHAVGKAFSAALPFAGSANRAITKNVGAGLSFAGTARRATTHSLAGALGFTGAVTASRTFFQNLSAALGFSGGITKSTQRPLAASLSPSGAIVRGITKHLPPAALSLTGSTTKATSRSLGGALSFTGATTKNIRKAFTAALSFVGALATAFVGVAAQILQIASFPVAGTVAAVVIVQLPGGPAIFYLLSYVPDEVPISEVATFRVQLAGSDGSRPTADLAPVMRVLDATGGTALANTTMTLSAGVWSASWTPTVAGPYSVEVRTALSGNTLAAQIPVTVRPRYDPIALALNDVLVSRM